MLVILIVGFLASNFAANLIVYGGPPPLATELPDVPLWVGLTAVIVVALVFGIQHIGFALTSPANIGAKVLTTFFAGLILGGLMLWMKRISTLVLGHWGLDLLFLGLPTLLVIGLLESFGGPHLNWMVAFCVMMTAWLIGSAVSGLRYR